MNRPLILLVLALVFPACVSDAGPGPVLAPGSPGSVIVAAGDTIDPDPGPPADRTAHPKLLFTAEGHYYGVQEKRTQIAHTAVFYNAGSQDLVIEKVKTHCGCAAALLSSNRIPPGGRGTMKVILETGNLPGKRTKNVEVFTNDPANPVAVYPISCDVIADAAVDPIMVVIRATRSSGPIQTAFDVYTMRPGFHLEVTSVVPSHDGIHARVSPIPPGKNRTGYRVDLEFGPEIGSGDFHERILVNTNSARDPRLTVDVIGSVRQSVLVVPERLYYPRLRSGDSASRRLYAYRTDGRPLGITGVEDPAGIFEVETKRVDAAKWELTILLSGEAPTETIRGSLIILTDAPDEPRVAVPYEIPGAE